MLRHFTPDDAGFILRLVNSDGWLRHIGNINVRSEADALAYISKGPVNSYLQNGFGSYLITLIGSNTPVGMCSLIKRDWLDRPDLGYAILPEFEKNGYAYEAAVICLEEMYSNGLTQGMSAIVSPLNQASIKLLGKLQFVFSRFTVSPGTGEELLLFNHDKKIV